MVSRDYILIVVHGLLSVLASLVLHGLWGARSPVVATHGSGIAALGLLSTGSIVAAHRLSCFEACGISPDRGIKPISPALAGKFFTTEPPGKPKPVPFGWLFCSVGVLEKKRLLICSTW